MGWAVVKFAEWLNRSKALGGRQRRYLTLPIKVVGRAG